MLGLVKYYRHDVNRAWNFLKKLSTFYRNFFQKPFYSPKFGIWSIFTSTKYKFWGATRNLRTKFHHRKINFLQFDDASRVITLYVSAPYHIWKLKFQGTKVCFYIPVNIFTRQKGSNLSDRLKIQPKEIFW